MIINLPGLPIETTSLGFGCGQLLRVSTASQRQRLLATALDSGIRHFDLARMYGLGQAEHEFGRFVEGKRERLVIATKFGIEANSLTRRFSFLQPAARAVIRALPGIRTAISRRSAAAYCPKDFSIIGAQRSLEASLRALRTDYLDLFLLHDPTPADAIRDDLVAWLEHLYAVGKIRGFGLAGGFEEVMSISERHPGLARVVQIPNDVLNRNLEKLERPNHGGAIITFSPFSAALAAIRELLRNQPARAFEWRNKFALNILDQDVIAQLMLTYCVRSNPHGVTLFSTSRPERVTELVRRCETSLIQSEQAEAFGNFVRDLSGNHSSLA